MPVSNRLKNQHLLWRAAFGPMTENLASLDHLSQKELWSLLLSRSEGQAVELKLIGASIEVPSPEMKPVPGADVAEQTKKVVTKTGAGGTKKFESSVVE